jgi:hypothetical protein
MPRAGWASSESHIAVGAIAWLVRIATDVKQFPSVHVAAIIGVSLIACTYARNRTKLKMADTASPPPQSFVSHVWAWIRKTPQTQCKPPETPKGTTL